MNSKLLVELIPLFQRDLGFNTPTLSVEILKSILIRYPDGSIGVVHKLYQLKTFAGQTIPHAHIHIIPRYKGDMKNPRGGVRGVIPGKREY